MRNFSGRDGVSFIWAEFICWISFMETRLKFTPPNVALVVGLSIAKVVWMLPYWSARFDTLLADDTPPSSSVPGYYFIFEQ